MKKKPYEVSEKSFRQTVMDACKLYKWEYYFTWNSIHSVGGFPDLFILKPPQSIYVELKKNSGKITPKQRHWLQLLRDCGYEVFIWRPQDFESIVERLKR